MKQAAVFLGLLATVAGSGCWRPYYGQMYAQPALPQAPVYQAPVVQQASPVYQQPQMIQQPCQPVICQPNPCCTPY